MCVIIDNHIIYDILWLSVPTAFYQTAAKKRRRRWTLLELPVGLTQRSEKQWRSSCPGKGSSKHCAPVFQKQSKKDVQHPISQMDVLDKICNQIKEGCYPQPKSVDGSSKVEKCWTNANGGFALRDAWCIVIFLTPKKVSVHRTLCGSLVTSEFTPSFLSWIEPLSWMKLDTEDPTPCQCPPFVPASVAAPPYSHSVVAAAHQALQAPWTSSTPGCCEQPYGP